MYNNTEQKLDKNEEENDSPVLKEIPVFLSQSLAGKLVLYQYPLEHGGLNTENSDVIQCSIKQNPHEIILELERNTESSNYSLSKGEQIAINVDGTDILNKNPEDVTFPKKLMDRQTFISRSLGNQNYAVGVLHENEMHITPLKTVALLRPSFKYIDKGDKRVKSESNLESDFSGEDEEELKQITVKFARQESDKSRKAREKSFSHVNKVNSKGLWYKSNFYNKRSDKSEVEFCKLYCSKPNDRARDLKMETDEILQIVSDVDESESKSSSHGDSLYLFKKLPLTEKVKKFLFQARLIQFSQLPKYLGTNCEIQEYLKVVQQVAVLVQGCWVVQSDIIYSKEILPGGITGSLMRAARDYILYLFTKSRTVKRAKILDTVKLPSCLVEEILKELSILLPSTREWEFSLQTDHEFIKMYPEVVQREYSKWEMKHEQLLESFRSTENNLAGSSPAKHRRKSHRDSSFSSDNESGVESRKNTYQISANKIRRTKKHGISLSKTNPKSSTT